MTEEVQEPKVGVYDFRDSFPEEVKAHESPQTVQSQGHYLAHPQGRSRVTFFPPLEFGGFVYISPSEPSSGFNSWP